MWYLMYAEKIIQLYIKSGEVIGIISGSKVSILHWNVKNLNPVECDKSYIFVVIPRKTTKKLMCKDTQQHIKEKSAKDIFMVWNMKWRKFARLTKRPTVILIRNRPQKWQNKELLISKF